MREHQIVITLKPEQFLEVQRLSRAAGAKSMGMFVRQKLLAALGMEGQPLVAAQQSVGPNVKRLTGELTRLHSQLKEFVAESLAPTYVTELPSPAYDAAVPQKEIPAPGEDLPAGGYEPDQLAEPAYDYEQQPAAPAPGTSESSVLLESEDKLEQFARRAFAISPRLGAIELPGESQPEPTLPPAATRKSRDPLEELLEESAQSQANQRMNSHSDADGTFDETSEEDDDEDAVFDVPLSLSNRSDRPPQEQKPEETPPAPIPPPRPPSPPAGPIDLSGGPPPKRRQ